MANPHNIKVGQKLWFVPGLYSNERKTGERELIVTKVGRDWATVDRYNWRIRLDSYKLYVDGGKYSSPGEVHTDRQAWEKEKSRKALWERIKREMGPDVPAHVSEEDMVAFLRSITNQKEA